MLSATTSTVPLDGGTTTGVDAPTAVTRDPALTSAWLAAFALGLAYSPRPEPELVCELRDVAGGRSWLLIQARRQLASRTVAEPVISRQGERLLELAASATPVVC